MAFLKAYCFNTIPYKNNTLFILGRVCRQTLVQDHFRVKSSSQAKARLVLGAEPVAAE